MASQGRISHCLVILSCLVISPFFCVAISYAADTLRDGQVMRDWEFLESSNKLFRLLFFSQGVSSNRYLGIQYMNFSLWSENGNQKKMVWVANRDSPLKDSSGVLNITQDGNLVIDYNGTFIAINSEQPAKSSNTSVTILDSGNLVLRAGEHILWQSFDYPSDTWLPGMKLGLFELNTGQPRQQFLTSWVSTQVPTVGAFTLGVDLNNKRQIIVWQRGVLYWHSGMWNGYNFSYFPEFNPISFSYFMNENESYFTYTRNGNNLSSWIQIDSSGEIDIFESNEDGWMLDETGHCDAKQVDDRSKGCVTLEPSNCTGGDVFNQTSGTMDMWDYMSNFSQGLTDCKEICLRDCSCNAYASALSDGSGCKFSNGQKVDYLVGEEFFYIRNSTLVEKNTPIPTTKDYANNTPPESPNNVHPDRPRKSQLWLTIAGPLAALIVLVPVSLLCYLRWRNHCFGGRNGSSKDGMSQGTQLLMYESSSGIAAAINEFSDAQKLEFIGKKDPELPLFSFPIIQMATDHFSHANKIGQGGFGPVYKGKLDNGQEIAVKRLSRSSGQGSEEFKNEVILISKLQHRNLVRLLGYCMQGEERILLYEYMPNKSLDSFLFDATKQALLDWKKRVHIIEGIAQGLLYLHKYSRLTIIHRDLKTSNVLLDCKMNPKISDFGTARIFGENESRASTNRIVGTYGYMSPEYAMDGLFSVKSDVFSFGVMLLEIISGKKNTGFYQSDRCLNLLGYAWDLWKEGRGLELIDPALAETCLTSEVMRYAQVGLLCVQESAADRPTMADVVSMLSNELMVLPAPKQPAFSAIVSVNNADLSKNTEPCSINDVTISRVDGR